ncbi:MAG TPA: hypothetical protein EYG95_01225 [Campylobacterales bacterium]|nr:hypothetical protein [Campylobacterales bacterium]
MVKLSYLLIFVLLTTEASQDFQDRCIQCHKTEGIPAEALYKRYLIKYSSQTKIKEAMLTYLKNPSIETSIMPEPFINKFGLQKRMSISEEALKKYINELVENYDVKKRLYIPKP